MMIIMTMTTRRRTPQKLNWIVTTTVVLVLWMVLLLTTVSEAFVVNVPKVAVPSSSTAEITTTGNRSRRKRTTNNIKNIIKLNKGQVSASTSTPPRPSSTTALSSSSLFTEFANGYNDWLDTYPLLTQAVTASVLAGVGDITAQLRQQQDDDEIGGLDLERLKRFTIKGLGGGIIWSFWYTIADTWTDQFMIQGETVLQQLQQLQQQDTSGGTVNLMTMLLSTIPGGSSNVGDSTIAAATTVTNAIDTTTSSVVLSTPPAQSVLMDVVADNTGVGGAESVMGNLQQYATVDPTTTITAASDKNNVICRTIISILLEQFFWCPIVYSLWDIPVPTLLAANQDNRSIPTQIKTKLPGLLVDNAKVWTLVNWIVYSVPLQYRVLVSSLADIVWQSIVSGHVMMDEEGSSEQAKTELEEQQQLILSSILGNNNNNEDETATTPGVATTTSTTDATGMATERV